MSHEITQSDRLVFRLAGGLPWHYNETNDGRSIGVERMTLEDAIRIANIESQVGMKTPLFFADGTPSRFYSVHHATDRTVEYQAVTSEYALPNYADVFRALRPLADEFGIEWETCGTIKRGGQAWLLGKLPQGFDIRHWDGRADEHRKYCAVQASLDGQLARKLYRTNVRIVCANTVAAAQEDAIEFGAKNVGNADARWGTALESAQTYMRESDNTQSELAELASTPMGEDEASDFYARLLCGMVAEHDRRDAAEALFLSSQRQRAEVVEELLASLEKSSNEARESLARAHSIGKNGALSTRTANLFAKRHTRLMEYFRSGIGNAGNDRYDAFNAVSQWADHDGVRDYRGTVREASEKRLVSVFAGDAAEVKQTALNMLRSH